MAIFNRKTEQELETRPGDMGLMLMQGRDMIEQTAEVHATQWGLGTAQRWDFDVAHGSLRWHFDDRVAEAPAQIIGTYNADAQSWRWAWSNDSLPEHLRQASGAVRDWGQLNNQPSLSAPKLDGLSSEQADELAAIGFRLTEGTGFYRASSSGPTIYLSFGAVTITGIDGTTRRIDLTVG